MKKRNTADELEKYRDVTVADMNVEGMPWYEEAGVKKNADELRELNLTKEERRAIIKGAYRAVLPAVGIIIGVFTVIFVLFMLYFKAVL